MQRSEFHLVAVTRAFGDASHTSLRGQHVRIEFILGNASIFSYSLR